MPAHAELRGNGVSVEGAFGGEVAAEDGFGEGAAAGVTPAFEAHAEDAAVRVDGEVDVAGLIEGGEAGADVRVIEGGPGDVFVEERGGQPEEFALEAADAGAANVGAGGFLHGDKAESEPAHFAVCFAGAVEDAVGAVDGQPVQASGGGPDHAALRVDDLFGGKGDPAVEFDVAVHAEMNGGGGASVGRDCVSKQAAHGLGERGEVAVFDHAVEGRSGGPEAGEIGVEAGVAAGDGDGGNDGGEEQDIGGDAEAGVGPAEDAESGGDGEGGEREVGPPGGLEQESEGRAGEGDAEQEPAEALEAGADLDAGEMSDAVHEEEDGQGDAHGAPPEEREARGEPMAGRLFSGGRELGLGECAQGW